MLVEKSKNDPTGHVMFFKMSSGDWVVTYYTFIHENEETGPMILIDNQHFGQVISDSSFSRAKCVVIRQEISRLRSNQIVLSFKAPEKLANEYHLLTKTA